MKHIKTVDQTLTLEIGYANSMMPSSLTDAIIEALEDVIDTADIVYIKAKAPNSTLVAVDIWSVEEDADEPPVAPDEEIEGPEPNV